jgi:hypothetical protein
MDSADFQNPSVASANDRFGDVPMLPVASLTGLNAAELRAPQTRAITELGLAVGG